MSSFTVISGETSAFSGTVKSTTVEIHTGIFKKEKIQLNKLNIETNGLQSSKKGSVRFYLDDGEREWMCEAKTKVFADLQAKIYKCKNQEEKTWQDIVIALIYYGIIALVITLIVKSCDTEDKPEDIERKLRLYQITNAQIALEETLRDPDSVDYTQKSINLDNSAICFSFRAKNGFGGYSKSLIVIHDGNVYENSQKKYAELCPPTANYENY
jgi:hypothetical protein